VRSSTVRTVLWALALVVALTVVGIAFVRGDGDGSGDDVVEPAPGPTVPGRPGDGCGDEAATDPADLRPDRPVARCGESAPEAIPLPAPATIRVAVTGRGPSAAPLLVADALGEFADENLTVEVVDLPASDAYAALARGEVDGVVGGVDAPFFDGARDGSGARLVLGGTLSRRPGDVEVAQTGLWARADLWDDPDDWRPIAGQTVAVADGLDSSALYPIGLTLDQEELNLNSVDTEAMGEDDAVDRLTGGQVGLA
jgi:NitT/TauT family transport system substrate-binding protein